MSRVYISSEFPEAVSRVFNDMIDLAACETVPSPESADVQILGRLPSSPTDIRTLIIHGDEVQPNQPNHYTFLKAPFTLSRLMMELHQAPSIRLPELANGWQVDGATRSFTHETHATIALTEREWDMCLYLLRQEDVVAQERLLQDLWGYDPSVESHTVETHIYRLRQKLEQHKNPPLTIETTEGGYKASI